VARVGLISLIIICTLAISAPRGPFKSLADCQDSISDKVIPEDTSRASGKAESKTVKTGQSKPTAKEDRAEQIKRKIRGLGLASRVTVQLNNGNERYGSIERIDEDSFQLAEVDLKQVFTVAYNDVRKIREGYGNPNQFTGKRWNPIWAKIAVTAAIVMFAIVIPLSIPKT
jgi:hypothetical protein